MSTQRLLQILSYISTAERPLSPQQLAENMEIPVSSIYRYIHELKTWGFITPSRQKTKLTAGPISIQMAQKFQEHSLLVEAVHPMLEKLALQTDETVALMVPSQYKALCVDMIESRHALRCSFAIGKATTLTQGASAKTMLAYMEPKQRKHIIQTLVKQQPARDELSKVLDIIQERGYGCSSGEVDQGIWGISAPILFKRKLQGVISIMAPEVRITGREAIFIASLQQVVAQIQEYLDVQ